MWISENHWKSQINGLKNYLTIKNIKFTVYIDLLQSKIHYEFIGNISNQKLNICSIYRIKGGTHFDRKIKEQRRNCLLYTSDAADE